MPERLPDDASAAAGRGEADDAPRAPGRDRVLSMLGMATRAGAVVPGTERVREAARSDTLRLAVIAADASENSRGKLLPLLDARGLSHVIRYERSELGAAVGRGPLSAVGVTDAALAKRLLVLLNDE